jgi:hypothetical protein
MKLKWHKYIIHEQKRQRDKEAKTDKDKDK